MQLAPLHDSSYLSFYTTCSIYNKTFFISGYHVFETKEIVLQPRKIAMHYIKTYFLFDFIPSIPLTYILIMVTGQTNSLYVIPIASLRLLRFARVKTMQSYFRQITSICRIGDTAHDVICLLMTTIYMVHWWACIAYLVPKLKYKILGVAEKSSWIYKADIIPSASYRWYQYFEALLMATCHFYLAGIGMYQTDDPVEQVILIVILLSGVMYFSYMVVVVLEMVSSANASESRYEEIMSQLKEYMASKKLSPTLRRRLMMYYENRFQKHYFREHAILATLSEHLRQELVLFCAQRLLHQVDIFEGLSKVVTNDIAAVLKQDVYLPNDIIFVSGQPAEALHFIVSGTLALFTPSGLEFRHIQDGDHFGEISFIVKETEQKHICTVVAVEITECLHLDVADFWYFMRTYEQFAARVSEVSWQKYFKIIEAIKRREDEYASGGGASASSRSDLVFELRSGKIISEARTRGPLIKK